MAVARRGLCNHFVTHHRLVLHEAAVFQWCCLICCNFCSRAMCSATNEMCRLQEEADPRGGDGSDLGASVILGLSQGKSSRAS